MASLTAAALSWQTAPVALALASALSWGVSDFLGGLASRRAAAFLVVAVAHGFSLAVVLLYAFVSHAAPPSLHTIEFGLAGGLAGGTGLVFFFGVLASGEMGIAASVAGVLTAIVPVVYSLLTEAAPTPLQLGGFALALVAIWLLTYSPGRAPGRKSLVAAALCGVCFGSMLVLLRLAGGGALWPLATARVSSTAIALLIGVGSLLRSRQKSVPTNVRGPVVFALAAISGLIDAGGNLLYTTSAIRGRLDIAAVLSSLYPGVTILLAAWLLKERARRSQAIGMALALAAVVMISM